MPNDEQGFDLEKLKTDPQMWMRFAMPSNSGNSLENVFKDKENPFDKNSKAAIETVQRLASEGKLYLRDHGRSRHFHKVEKDGDELKLGEQHEMKLSNRTTDPVLGTLMWMSHGYFKWLGLERISNWFDERMKRRDEIKELDKRYKEEYKSLTKEQKKKLKSLRKHEKNLKKLEKAKNEAEKTQQEIDKLRGKDTTKTKGEMASPLSQPPQVEPENNTMQPTRLGDQPVQEKQPVQQTRENNLVQEKAAQYEITGAEKEAPQKKEKNNQIIIEGEELTEGNINKFPPQVVEAFKIIQQLIIEKEANEKTNQQPVQEQPEQIAPESQPVENVDKQEETAQQEGALNEQDDLEKNAKQNEEPVQTNDLAKQEQRLPNNPDRSTPDAEVPRQEMDAPLKEGADLEPEQVNIQERHKDQSQTNLQDRLAAEKQEMDAVKHWRDMLTDSLFSHAEGKPMGDFLQTIQDDRTHYSTALSGIAFGVLTQNAAAPESQRQVMDALLNGQSLGSQNNDLINKGIDAYNHAAEQMNAGNHEPMEKMLADAVRELSHQASQETSLSPRQIMITRLISNAFKIAQNNDLELPLSKEEMQFAQGATELGKLSANYHAARQYLGKEPMDINSLKGREAVSDLLAGKAVENMMRQDKEDPQGISATQIFMGIGLWCVENIKTMITSSVARKEIGQEKVQEILEKPDGFQAARVSKDVANEILAETIEAQKNPERTPEMQKKMELGQQENQPEINPLNMPG